MNAILVFDNFNDLVYSHCCDRFLAHVSRLAKSQGLANYSDDDNLSKSGLAADSDILIQLFSPLVASQRFMKEQFRNAYSSVQCEDGTSVVFSSFMGFLFLRIGTEEVAFLQREVHVCITLVVLLCGPDVRALKTSKDLNGELTSLLRTWSALQSQDQTFLIEALAQPLKNPQINSSLIKCLEDISARVKFQNEGVHSLLFAGTRLLSWYSNKTAYPMSPQDVLILLVMCEKNWPRDGLYPEDTYKQEHTRNSPPPAKPLGGVNRIIYLHDGTHFLPHRLNIGEVRKGVYLAILVQHRYVRILTAMCTMIQLLVDYRDAKRDEKRDKGYFDMMDNVAKTIIESMKKDKAGGLLNEFNQRWTRFRLGLQLYFKTMDTISVQPNPVIDLLLGACRIYFQEDENDGQGRLLLQSVWEKIHNKSVPSWKVFTCLSVANADWLNAEASFSSVPLALFSGLIHYIYVDRTSHTMHYPSVVSKSPDEPAVTRDKIWAMVKFARAHLQHGHFSIMWKDSNFNYSYFLWFEDSGGTSIAPRINAASPRQGEDVPFMPGLFCGDFYKRLVEDCFPSNPRQKVHCKELFCVHRGPVTSSVVLEHSKKLATHLKTSERTTCMVDVL